jgi:hypothetical protein
LLLTLSGVCGISRLCAQPVTPRPGQEVQTLVRSYCVACHGEQKSEGDLRLDQISTQQWNDYDIFDEIVARIEDGEMPPGDAKKPIRDSDRAALLSHLKSRLAALGKSQLAGRYKKLTAQEYSNTLADTFGHPIEKLKNLPFDSDKDLKKLGEHQVVTSYAAKKYYDVAQDYLDRHILAEVPRVKEVSYIAKDNPKEFVHTSRFGGTPIGPLTGQGNPPAFMLRVPVGSYAEEGEYDVTFDWNCFYLKAKERFDHTKEYKLTAPAFPPEVTYKSQLCRIDQPIRVVLDKETKFIGFRVNSASFRSKEADPRYAEIQEADLANDEKKAAIKALSRKIKAENKDKDRLCLLITGATFRGPLKKLEPPSHALIFDDVKRSDPFEVCPPIIKRLAYRLFRRPVSDDILERYYAIARAERDEGNNTYLAVKAALNAMLCSPHFLFKYEGNREDLDDYMIAARLSYFLVNSTPDEKLLELAAAGRLRDAAVRRQQALRLLNDREKSARFTQNFTQQWLGLRKFGEYTPNEAYMPATTFASLQPHLAREPQEFLNEILHNNLSALNFIHSDFVVWNEQLSSHYQRGKPNFKVDKSKKGVGKEDFYRREIVQDPSMTRGGLMTMASIMSLTTDGENTQPILRGVWIARRMLGIEIEPPATIPAIEVNLENVSKPREILAKHKEDRSCYACRAKFDHFGLAMENYDVIGRWKTDYVHPVQNEKGKFELITKDPIDSLAETPNGEPMPGVAGVKNYLLANRDVVMRNLVERLFSYALGREVRYKDRDQIRSLLKEAREDDYKLQDLILALVESRSFTDR